MSSVLASRTNMREPSAALSFHGPNSGIFIDLRLNKSSACELEMHPTLQQMVAELG